MDVLIAIADDEALFRRGMRLILEDYPGLQVMLEAENGQDLLDKIRASDELPDVLLLDLKMPVMGGIEAAEVIRREFPSILIIVISSHFSKAFIINMIEIGASAYLGKNTAPDEVVETIRMVREKGFYYNTSVMAIIRENIMAPMQGKNSRDMQVEITNREKEVLQLICEEYTTQEIADRLFLSVRTVDGHRNNLLSKLGCRNTAGLVVYALQNGLVKIRE
ncbi:MAG TPA: response regulator transcription factor [Saprospiraceae bacterium]|nr:response regulator transcription factor [Saprospiraceae bacterium]HPI05340.1 response regulator transcription factor [Saprospiraceae bacterium]